MIDDFTLSAKGRVIAKRALKPVVSANTSVGFLQVLVIQGFTFTFFMKTHSFPPSCNGPFVLLLTIPKSFLLIHWNNIEFSLLVPLIL